MLCEFYSSTFSKRNNSTKVPPDSVAKSAFDITLKGGCDIDSPTILLDLPDTAGVVPEYPYMRLRVNGLWHYYYINSHTALTDNVWSFDCELDVLATFKDWILNNTCYVQYSTSHGSTLIRDPRAMMLPYTTTLSKSFSDLSGMFTRELKYVLQCIGDNGSRDIAYASAFILNSSQSSSLKSVLNSPNFFTYIAQLGGGELGIVSDPSYGVISGAVTAYNMTDTINQTINLAGYNTGVSGIPVASTYIDKKTSSIKPKSALKLYGDYRDLEPYSSYTLQLPFVGVVPISSKAVARTQDLILECSVQPATGDVLYSVYCDSDAASETPILIGQYSGNCSADSPVSTRNINKQGVAASFWNTLMGAVGGDSWGFGSNSSINGNISSVVGISGGLIPYVMKQSVTTSENPANRSAVDGLPCGQTLLLSKLSGYCQCQGASVDVPCNSRERDRINSYLNGGFYIE